MASDEPGMLELAERFFAAVTAGDLEAVRAMYAPDAVVWHNYDRASQSVDENLRVLGALPSLVENFRYDDVRRQATLDGFIEQHVVRGTTPGGDELDIPACIVCTVVGGRITRLDEYFDSSHIAPLLRP
ncbi:MAG TPA: nuclear transport factor 2 family protein [Dehalococcoidia bacterium]